MTMNAEGNRQTENTAKILYIDCENAAITHQQEEENFLGFDSRFQEDLIPSAIWNLEHLPWNGKNHAQRKKNTLEQTRLIIYFFLSLQ